VGSDIEALSIIDTSDEAKIVGFTNILLVGKYKGRFQ
jgi:hypothetical protein